MRNIFSISKMAHWRKISILMILSISILFSTHVMSDSTMGTHKVVVLHVYFQDYANASRFSKSEVEGLYGNLDDLWQDTSYNNLSVNALVSDLYQLPDVRSMYIDDFGDGDLSNGSKYTKVLTDAVANAPASIDWTDVDAVNVIMAETDAAQFHRGQANKCNLPVGVGDALKLVGCAIFSENPSSSELRVWGRWAHEMGHTFQAGGPAHPSNYNSDFELLDANLPGQTGVFEKQDHVAFPGWMPSTKYQEFEPASGGGSAALWAMEYNPSGMPNAQAVKIKITDSFYYLVSVRRAVLGDDLNGFFSPPGIPDEGVLIERVSEGSNPWVRVIGRYGSGGNCGAGCDRADLWHEGDVYDGGADGIFIYIIKNHDDDNYSIRVAYQDQSMQPDVMINPWTSPPSNSWETTDIWIDSPINGYDNYRYGTWSDLFGGIVPRGNGDDPAVGLVNRVYVRVRNVGSSPAINTVVNVEITDPLGVGIAGSSGWAALGSVDSGDFPALANIPAGGTVDVYVEWTPDFAISAEDMADGIFAFHSCLRVKLDAVANETVFGNQDGSREQENISFFEAPAAGGPPASGKSQITYIKLRNDDLTEKKHFYLNYDSKLPKEWKVSVNKGVHAFLLAPNEVKKIPVEITPTTNEPAGKTFSVDVSASSIKMLVNDRDPKDLHPEYNVLGGVSVSAAAVLPTDINCKAKRLYNLIYRNSGSFVYVKGSFSETKHIHQLMDEYYDRKNVWKVLLQGVDKKGRYVKGSQRLVSVDKNGNFSGYLYTRKSPVHDVVCLFAGTRELGRSSSGYVKIKGKHWYKPPYYKNSNLIDFKVQGTNRLTIGLN